MRNFKNLITVVFIFCCQHVDAQLTAAQTRSLVKLTADSVRKEYKDALNKQVQNQLVTDQIQDTKIKMCQDTIRMYRDEVRLTRDTLKMVRDSLNSIRPVVFSDGFTVIRSKAVDTVKNTVSLNIKSIADSFSAIIVALDVETIRASAYRSEKVLKEIDVSALKSDMDKIKLTLQTPIIILKQ